jgi:hypothetical protein
MIENVGAQVQKAIAEGRRVQEAVQQITLKALTERQLDFAAMRKVTREAIDAVRESATAQGEGMKDAAKQAVAGVDDALAKAAEALKLSLQEAGGRMEKFSSEDLTKARKDLADTEKMFIDTLSGAAHTAQGAARATFEDLARHAQASGTAIGRQLRESAALSGQVSDAARAQFRAGMEAAATSGAIFARAAAGVLAGLAEAIDPKHKTDKKP